MISNVKFRLRRRIRPSSCCTPSPHAFERTCFFLSMYVTDVTQARPWDGRSFTVVKVFRVKYREIAFKHVHSIHPVPPHPMLPDRRTSILHCLPLKPSLLSTWEPAVDVRREGKSRKRRPSPRLILPVRQLSGSCRQVRHNNECQERCKEKEACSQKKSLRSAIKLHDPMCMRPLRTYDRLKRRELEHQIMSGLVPLKNMCSPVPPSLR